MATHDDTDRLAREARVIRTESRRCGRNIGALEFHDRPVDRLSARLSQVESLLSATIGEPGEGWRLLADEVKENYLWAALDLIRASRGDLECIESAAIERRAGAAA
jgi:hypothetical protein